MAVIKSDFYNYSTYRSSSLEKVANNLKFILCDHGYAHLNKNWHFPNRNDPYNRLYFIKDGEGTVTINGKTIVLAKNRVYLFPLHCNLDLHCPKYLEQFYVHFNLEIYALFDIFELFTLNKFSKKIDPDTFEIIKKFKSDELKDILILKDFLYDCIFQFVDFRSKKIAEKLQIAAKYQSTTSFINKNLGADLTVERIAQAASITPSYFSAMFKKDTGKSLKSLIKEKIISKAKLELTSTDKRIKEIAYLLRFKDEFYFSKYFKKEVNLSPTKYRQKFIP